MSKETKIATVTNMDGTGQIQCPHCHVFDYPRHKESYKPGKRRCFYCKKIMLLDKETAMLGNKMLNAPADYNAAARAKRYVRQSPNCKFIHAYEKTRLIRGIARMLREAYKQGAMSGNARRA